MLKYLNENYMPAGKKTTLTEEELKIGNIKSTIKKKFVLVFHPDKCVNEERKV